MKNSKVRAKKHLGQHFLSDKNIAQKIVNSLNNGVQGNIVEIGPGTGVLSQFLADSLEKDTLYFLLDVDKESIAYLEDQEQYKKENISILNQDILISNLNDFGEILRIIGNLPYNITSPILFLLLENKELVGDAVFMIQKEVAERICADHGNKTYGILSVLLQTYFKAEYLFEVGPQNFIPPPKVWSSVIALRSKESVEVDFKILKSIVKKSFNNRRKMLRNTLSQELDELGEEFDKFRTLRPEQISVSDFGTIALALSKSRNAI